MFVSASFMREVTMKLGSIWMAPMLCGLALCLAPDGAFAKCDQIKAIYWDTTRDGAEEGVNQQVEDCKDAALPGARWRSGSPRQPECTKYRAGSPGRGYVEEIEKIVCRGGQHPIAWYCVQKGLACQ